MARRVTRDRDESGRPRNARPRDALGRLLPRDAGRPVAPVDAPALPPAAALEHAQELLDTGKPFAAHEVLEAVWKAAGARERPLWRGLAQLAVAVTHAARGNPAGAAALRARAAATLEECTGSPYDVDIATLRAWAAHGEGAMPPLRRRG